MYNADIIYVYVFAWKMDIGFGIYSLRRQSYWYMIPIIKLSIFDVRQTILGL